MTSGRGATLGDNFTSGVPMSVEQSIRDKLTNIFAPTYLEIENESHKHSGHAGSPGTGESHFRVHIKAPAFAGRSRLECHRMVNDVLADELAGPVHALAIHAAPS